MRHREKKVIAGFYAPRSINSLFLVILEILHILCLQTSSSFFLCGRSDCDVNFYLFQARLDDLSSHSIVIEDKWRFSIDETFDSVDKARISCPREHNCWGAFLSTAFKIPELKKERRSYNIATNIKSSRVLCFTVSYEKVIIMFSITFQLYRNSFLCQFKPKKTKRPLRTRIRIRKCPLLINEQWMKLSSHKTPHHLNYWCHLTMALNYLLFVYVCLALTTTLADATKHSMLFKGNKLSAPALRGIMTRLSTCFLSAIVRATHPSTDYRNDWHVYGEKTTFREWWIHRQQSLPDLSAAIAESSQALMKQFIFSIALKIHLNLHWIN